MKEALETIIRNIVEKTEEIEIKEIEKEKQVIFEVKVAQSDMGRIIGKQGKVARAIRSVMKAIGNREQKRVTIEFIG